MIKTLYTHMFIVKMLMQGQREDTVWATTRSAVASKASVTSLHSSAQSLGCLQFNAQTGVVLSAAVLECKKKPPKPPLQNTTYYKPFHCYGAEWTHKKHSFKGLVLIKRFTIKLIVCWFLFFFLLFINIPVKNTISLSLSLKYSIYHSNL